ncbi:MAG: FAD binding domain-containing protein, partial [Nitrososphaerales archaeon]
MPRFDYVRAQSIEHALELMGDSSYKSRALAGGTDLLVLIRHQPPSFDRVVDLTRVPEMKAIERWGNEVYLGAAATFTEVAESRVMQEFAPCLVEAAVTVGGPAIRNMGTVGGNTINAAACADGVPSLVCLDAVAHLAGAHGTRSLLVGDLVTGANRTAIQPGELLTHFTFPIPPPGSRQAFYKLGRRNAQAISRLSMAAAGRLDGQGCIDYVRLVPGAAMPTPRRFAAVEAMLLGRKPAEDLLAAAGIRTAELMLEVTGRRWSTEYKEVVIQAL